MKKRVLLLAVSCKKGGLCPGGLDLDDPSKWIRIVRDDGQAGAVKGCDIDFAQPLDVITFDGRPMPQGKQLENWVVDNNSCKNLGKAKLKNGNNSDNAILDWAYSRYSYHGFWGNNLAYLYKSEFEDVKDPSESMLKVSNVRIYKNVNGRAKIDFDWNGSYYRLCGISMTDQDYYGQIQKGDVTFKQAYIVISIPKQLDDWVNPQSGQKLAYKFVSRVYDIS